MGGASLQLTFYGQQDVLLTGAPEVSFFKLVYRRHTLFSMESSEQMFQSSANFGKQAKVPITKSGDLVTDCWLQVTLPNLEEYAFDALQTPTTTIPAIHTARWTSSTTARVTVKAPTAEMTPVQGATIRYRATLDPANTVSTTHFYSAAGETTIPLTGLDSSVAYTVTVRREQLVNNAVNASGGESDAMTIESLRWTNSIGHALIRNVELEIGGIRIDRHESDYMDIMTEFTLPEEKRAGFNDMIGRYENYDLYDNSFQDGRTLFIPLRFSFCQSPGLSLPLVSLVYPTVVVNFDFRNYTELVRSTTPVTTLTHLTTGETPSMDCRFYATFILLDTEERRLFANRPHEYLISQCQFTGDKPVIVDANNPNLNVKLDLTFSHPVKELIWVYQTAPSYNSNIVTTEYATQGNDWFNYSLPSADVDPFVTGKIQLNGHDRTIAMPAKYYRLMEPYKRHSRIPNKKIYSYSFALHPEDFQPSGTCNFSRVDTAHLVLSMDPSLLTTSTKGRIRIFANSYNVFRVASGSGGLAYVGA